MTDTRSKLISLLRQYPVAQSEYLHDGRGRVHPAEAFADKIMELFSVQDHTDLTQAARDYLRNGGTPPVPSLMTVEGQKEYYRDTAAETYTELKRVSLDLAWYEAHEENQERSNDLR